MSKATADELRLLIRSGWRLIVLETFEEDRALQILGAAEDGLQISQRLRVFGEEARELF